MNRREGREKDWQGGVEDEHTRTTKIEGRQIARVKHTCRCGSNNSVWDDGERAFSSRIYGIVN